MSDFIVSTRTTFLGLRLPLLRRVARGWLREACLRTVPLCTASDRTHFHTRGAMTATEWDTYCSGNSRIRTCWKSLTRRMRQGGTFYLAYRSVSKDEVAALVERCLRDIGLDPGMVTKRTRPGLPDTYEIPLKGVLLVTHALVEFNTARSDDRVILVAVSLTAL